MKNPKTVQPKLTEIQLHCSVAVLPLLVLRIDDFSDSDYLVMMIFLTLPDFNNSFPLLTCPELHF